MDLKNRMSSYVKLKNKTKQKEQPFISSVQPQTVTLPPYGHWENNGKTKD